MSQRPSLSIAVNRTKASLTLSRAEYYVESTDIPRAISDQSFNVTVAYEAKSDKSRPYLLSVSFFETYDTVADLARLANGDLLPDIVVVKTFSGAGNLVSMREFANLALRNSNIGYARMGKNEQPVQYLTYECVLSDTDFRQVEI